MSASQPNTPLSFEQALEQLEGVVRKLEEGELGLNESLSAYEAGIGHLKQCYTALETAERKIEILARIDAAGNVITQPFDDEEQDLTEKAESRSRRRTAKTKESPPSAQRDIDDSPGLF